MDRRPPPHNWRAERPPRLFTRAGLVGPCRAHRDCARPARWWHLASEHRISQLSQWGAAAVADLERRVPGRRGQPVTRCRGYRPGPFRRTSGRSLSGGFKKLVRSARSLRTVTLAGREERKGFPAATPGRPGSHDSGSTTDREGQPAANVQQRVWVRSVHGWDLDIRVFFATQHRAERYRRRRKPNLPAYCSLTPCSLACASILRA